MDTRSQITIRTKKLGVLLRDARLASRKTLQECGEAVGVTKGIFKSYEEAAVPRPCRNWKRWSFS